VTRYFLANLPNRFFEKQLKEEKKKMEENKIQEKQQERPL